MAWGYYPIVEDQRARFIDEMETGTLELFIRKWVSKTQGPSISGNLHICVYKNTYIHTYIHTYLHTYMHTYIHTYIPTYLHTHTHTRARARAHTHTHTHTHTRTYIYIYIHTYIYIYIHTYIYIYICVYVVPWCFLQRSCQVPPEREDRVLDQTRLRLKRIVTEASSDQAQRVHSTYMVQSMVSVVVISLMVWVSIPHMNT